jgi:polyphenol oxidase
VKELFRKDDCHVYRAVPLLELDWLEHGFGSRASRGWMSEPEPISLKQVHSDVCVYADGRATGRIGEGDALITDVPGAAIAVRTADCIPILLVDTRKRAVAAVHAGWRGTVQRIAAKAVGAMADRFGSRPRDMLAAVGPGIGGCCYEVGEEVAVQFCDMFPERNDWTDRTHVDLAEANRRQLVSAGLAKDAMWAAGLCTVCLAQEFFSWRRDREKAGRMVSAIRIK